MKLDGEQVVCHSTVGHKSDSTPYLFVDTKPFANTDKPLDSVGLNAEGFVKDDQNRLMHDKKGNDLSHYLEKTGDGWPVSNLDCSMSVNGFANGNEKEVRDFVTSNCHSSKITDPFQDSVFYLDKSVMECALPELVVCYKESTFHVVKDICIDEGVPTQDKFLFDCGVDEKSECNFVPSEKDQDCKLLKEKFESDISMQVGFMCLEDNQADNVINSDCGSNKKLDADTCTQDISSPNKGILSQCDSKDLIMTRKMKDDRMKMITNDVSKGLFTLGELLSLPELSTENSEAMTSNCIHNGIEQRSFQNSRDKEVMVTPPFVSEDKELNNSCEETILSATASTSVVEKPESGEGEATELIPAKASTSGESTSSLVNEDSDDSKLAVPSITVGSDSSAPTNSNDEGGHNLDHGLLETGGRLKLDDTADQPFSNNLQRDYGESSFSAAGHVTGLITYSGPIAYSGSLSHRSDSSTTSTRSFAFPVLQSEWNSSPVRMAKADRRHYRKHRGWRQSLLCCRF